MLPLETQACKQNPPQSAIYSRTVAWQYLICTFILSCKSQGSSKEPQDNDNMAAHEFPLKKLKKKN